MSNTKIVITFDDGWSWEYVVNDEVEGKIRGGDLFVVSAKHPRYSEPSDTIIGFELAARLQ